MHTSDDVVSPHALHIVLAIQVFCVYRHQAPRLQDWALNCTVFGGEAVGFWAPAGAFLFACSTAAEAPAGPKVWQGRLAGSIVVIKA